MSSGPPSSLAALSPGKSATIRALSVSAREAAWLRAVGLEEGVEVTVLRRAPFRGPLHVRTAGGAELAVDWALAGQVLLGASA
ncbi:MAG: FeoA family protein [Myxococcota bacterium]